MTARERLDQIQEDLENPWKAVDVRALLAALRAVLDLHEPIADATGSDIFWCAEDCYSHPCATVMAVERALGGSDGH